jgi:hypothetical protein
MGLEARCIFYSQCKHMYISPPCCLPCCYVTRKSNVLRENKPIGDIEIVVTILDRLHAADRASGTS